MGYVGMVATILSHIVAPLYMGRRKYNKWITAGFWILYAVFSLCLVLLQGNTPYPYIGITVALLIVFYITSEGSVGEKLFLFLTYANSFCIYMGARQFITVFLDNPAYLPVCEIGLMILMHAILCNHLIPIYKKAKIFFQSGWLKLNSILIFFFIQFVNQYAFSVVDKQSAKSSVLDFIIFSTIFYSTLTLIFSSVKDVAEMNRKKLENDELKNMAFKDFLTNIQNRTAYMKFTRRQTLNHRMNKDSSFISVVMDIDGFKRINDESGHAEGDRVLREVGAIILEHFQDIKCEIFRVGGDEFVLLTENMTMQDIETQMILMNEKLHKKTGTTVSYGCSEVDFNNAKPFDVAFKKADEIMYDSKQRKRVGV